MTSSVLLFTIGLLLLIKGGTWFVDGAAEIARKLHISELIIGATIVSVGTTLPEVLVSVSSALSGHGSIAYGNALGSIICNAGLIAALSIIAKPSPIKPETLRFPIVYFFISLSVYLYAAYFLHTFTKFIGFILLILFLLYLVLLIRFSKKNRNRESRR